MAHDVFISYSRLDSEAASAVERYLANEGFDCYRDVTNIPGSEEWIKSITQAIRECRVYLALLSKNSLESEHVVLELTFGKKHKKAFVPVFLADNLEVPDEVDFLLGNRQYTYAKPSLKAALPKIGDAVHRSVDRSRHADAYEDEAAVRARATYGHDADFGVDALGLPLGERESEITSVRAGAYLFTSRPGHYAAHQLTSLPVTAEFVLEVSIRRTARSGPSVAQQLGAPPISGRFALESLVNQTIVFNGEWAGFEFGANWPGDYYQFLLDDKGALRIARHVNREWTDLLYRERTKHFRIGDEANVLKVVRKERRFHVFVNGLYAVTVDDFDIRTGRFGLTIGRGITVEFAGLRMTGVDLESVCRKAVAHWDRLEMIEARRLLTYVAQYDAAWKLSGMDLDAGSMLLENRPDRRESVIVVIGASVSAQIRDRIAAERIREEINKRGCDHPHRWAAIVTDTAVLEERLYLECPVIAVGAPEANKVTARFLKALPAAAEVPEKQASVYHNVCEGERRMALWGPDAAEALLSSGVLDRFLSMIWASA